MEIAEGGLSNHSVDVEPSSFMFLVLQDSLYLAIPLLQYLYVLVNIYYCLKIFRRALLKTIVEAYLCV